MKTILMSVALSIVLFSTNFYAISAYEGYKVGAQNTETIVATFDGAEGNYFFFTDINNKAVQFESIDNSILKKFNLLDGDFIGDAFKIGYNDSKILSLKQGNTK